jgi:type I restriction enzyme, S subunit
MTLGLPSSWANTTLSEISAKIVDGSHNPPAKQSSGYPMLSARNIENGQIVYSDFRNISERDFELENARTQVAPGDILLTIVGTIGRSAVVPESSPPFALQRSVAVLNLIEVEPKFCMYQLQSGTVQSWLGSVATGTAQIGVYLKTLATMPLVLAPLAEQHRIVAEIEKQFTRLDAAVASLRRVQANLKRYRAAVLKAACEGRLVETEAALARAEQRPYESATELLQRILRERRARWEADQLAKIEAAGKPPKDDKWKARYEEPAAPDTSTLPELPEGWTWCSLRMIAELKGGITKGQKRQSGEKVLSVPYLRVANVQRGFFDLREVKNIEATEDEIEELRLLVGDILFNEGGDRDKLGRGWVWQGEIADCIHQNHIFRARLFLSEMPAKYVSYYGNSEAQDYFLAQAKQTTNLASINMSKLGALPVPLPPLVEQHRIVEELECRLSIIDGLERSLETSLQRADTLRQKVLQDAFTGKLVGQDPNDEPASKLLERIKAERLRREAEEREKRKEERKTVKKTGKTATGERRKLVEVLREAERPLAPEVLFREAGFKAEEVEAFYDELKQADKDDLITENKHPNGDVYLSARA